MRNVILLLCLLIVPMSGNAQVIPNPIAFGIGASFNTPAGDFNSQAGPGWGGMAGIKVAVPIIDITGIAEYIDFGSEDVTGGSRDATMWGLAAGARLSIFAMVYAGAEIGTYTVTKKENIASAETEGKITYGSYGPIVGVNLMGFDFNARYLVMDQTSFTSLRATYWF